jgi:hypothetical protein
LILIGRYKKTPMEIVVFLLDNYGFNFNKNPWTKTNKLGQSFQKIVLVEEFSDLNIPLQKKRLEILQILVIKSAQNLFITTQYKNNK